MRHPLKITTLYSGLSPIRATPGLFANTLGLQRRVPCVRSE